MDGMTDNKAGAGQCPMGTRALEQKLAQEATVTGGRSS